ncbi:MAG TPA: phenylalanine--tRNA ligase subunit beta [Bacteroidota bacterium]
MRVSLKWLRQYVDVRTSPEALSSRLTMQGLEVENIERPGDAYRDFVVGEVLEVNRHPNADRLTVCRVNVGKQALSIVCGAPNVAVGQKVPVALVGAVIPRGQHDLGGKPFRLERVRIRGVESNGMICSSYELGLGEDAEGIMLLNGDGKVGSPLSRELGLEDVVLDIVVTPNRPDCLSHIGVARELAAAYGKKLKTPPLSVRESREKASRHVSISVKDRRGCPRYTARLIRNVRVGPSPKWLQDVLTTVGLRPVNNVVDVTNYVLTEFGHPLHPFDFDKLSGGSIIVKPAADGEVFVTLDGKKRTLNSETLMICDAEKAVAIAGIMGGSNTEISSSTRNVLLESAYFEPRGIRRASKFLGLSTDASQRFERGTDPNVTVAAVNRAAQLIARVAGGEVLRGVVDVYPVKERPRRLRLRTGRVNEVLGTTLSKTTIGRLLVSLGLTVRSEKGGHYVVEVPTFRVDLEREIDLIEEVVRLHGYDKIEEKQVSLVQLGKTAPEVPFADDVREYFVGAGFQEIVTNSLDRKEVVDLCSDYAVEVLNPISRDMAALRASMVPGMLYAVRHNINRGNKDLRLFELGRVYTLDPTMSGKGFVQGYNEEEHLSIALTGNANLAEWYGQERSFDTFDLKGDIETFFQKIFLDKIRFIYYSRRNTLSDTPILIEINGSYAGYFGSVSEDWLQKFEIDQQVFVCELHVALLQVNRERARKYKPLPKFPGVARDLAFIVDRSTAVEKLKKHVERSGGELLRFVRLFDVYTGENISSDKKSVAYSLEFRSDERTLKEEEVEGIIGEIVREMATAFGAELRKQ